MDIYGYGFPTGYEGGKCRPKIDVYNNSSFSNSSYKKFNTFEQDSLNDLYRWMENFTKVIDEYSEQRHKYQNYKRHDVDNERFMQSLKLEVSDNRGFLEDMRKGFDWFVATFEYAPRSYQNFVKQFSVELYRLKRLKKYLSYRVRSLAGKGMYNEPSKDTLRYIRVRINAISILFDPRYEERRPLDEIYDEDSDDKLSDLNGNDLFYPYD